MKRLLRPKILVLFIIICGGTYALTSSVAIAVGVAILMIVADWLVGNWADRKDNEYFYGKTNTGTNADNTDTDGKAE